MIFSMNFPDVASFEVGQDLARELGVTFQVKHGPKDPALEGLRIVEVFGLPERMAHFQDLFAVTISRKRAEKQEQINKLNRLFGWS